MKRNSILQRSGEAIANPAAYRQPKTDHLDGRYPYEPDPKPSEPEVSCAYGVEGVHKVLRIIENSSLSTKTRVLALTQLLDMVSSQEIQAALIHNSGVKILTKGLKQEWTGEPVSRALAGEILAELATNKNGRFHFLQLSTVAVLVRALAKPQHDSVRLGASLALCSVSEFRDGLEILETQAKLMPQLVSSLGDKNTAVLANMARFFSNVSAHKELLAPALQSKLTDQLVALLGQGKSPHRRKIFVSTLTAIQNLSFSEAGNQMAIELSTAKRIAQATQATFSYFWEDVARASAGAFMALAGSEDGKKQIHAYAVPVIVRLVRSHASQKGMAGQVESQSTRNNAASAIRITSEYPPALEQILQELLPFTRNIVFVFGAGIPAANPGTRLKALRVLSRWLVNDDEDVRLNVVRAITALVQQDPNDAVQDAMSCLNIVYNLAVNGEVFGTEKGQLTQMLLNTLCFHSSVAVKHLKKAITDDGVDVCDEVYNIVFN